MQESRQLHDSLPLMFGPTAPLWGQLTRTKPSVLNRLKRGFCLDHLWVKVVIKSQQSEHKLLVSYEAFLGHSFAFEYMFYRTKAFFSIC